ncbi:phospholipase D-like domain-containing protein [Vibrio owensii]|uniref:phospholipase D-like domain-containing protein n=1 Tax=Vibrio owensii TaxID=696485 RepID=UPI003390B394
MYNQLLDSKQLAQLVSADLKESENATIVSAYITLPAITWLTKHLNHRNVSILGRFTPRDFLSGASDFKALMTSIERGYEVSILPNLHAKIYVVDRRSIYAASANFTAKGFSLCSSSNEEVAVKLPFTNENQQFIEKLFRASKLLSKSDLIKMQDLLDEQLLDDCIDENSLEDWGDMFDTTDELFVSDLPMNHPGQSCAPYEKNPDFVFAQIHRDLCISSQQAKIRFCKSKIFKWLLKQFSKEETQELRFGQISKLLHDALQDDPSPYRKDVKLYQSYLYSYIELMATEYFDLYIPGARTQVLKLKV